MGPFGLGLGSSMGLWRFCITMAVYYLRGKSKLKFEVRSFNGKGAMDIVKVGYPGALSRFLEMFRCIIVNILIIKYVTSTGLSAFAAVDSALALFWPIPFGMASAVRILPICMPLSVICLAYSCHAQSMEIKKLSVLIPIMDGAVNVVVLSMILIPMLKMNGLYIANVANGVLVILLIMLYITISNKGLSRKLGDTLLFPDGFGADEDKVFDISVKNMEDVLSVSKKVTEFCLGNGIDSRRSNFAGLALEEMAGNVVEHGFNADGKKHTIDLRVVKKDEDVILRIRDDCKEFDPVDRSLILDSDDEKVIRYLNTIREFIIPGWMRIMGAKR